MMQDQEIADIDQGRSIISDIHTVSLGSSSCHHDMP